MKEALLWAKDRQLLDGDDANYPPENIVFFSDCTAVRVTSEWSGPYSEVTPDIDVDPPTWQIGTPEVKSLAK